MELDDHGFEIDSRWTKRSVCLEQNSDCEHWSWVARWAGSGESVWLGYQVLLNVVEQTGRMRIRGGGWRKQKSGVGSNDVLARSLRQGGRGCAAKEKQAPGRSRCRERRHRWRRRGFAPVQMPHGNQRTRQHESADRLAAVRR